MQGDNRSPAYDRFHAIDQHLTNCILTLGEVLRLLLSASGLDLSITVGFTLGSDFRNLPLGT
jgi:hypothetical protein